MARATLQQMQAAIRDAARQVARYREAGNQTMEIQWRREMQRLTNLYSSAVAGQAIDDAQLSPGEWAKATIRQAGRNIFGMGKMIVPVVIALLVLPMLKGNR